MKSLVNSTLLTNAFDEFCEVGVRKGECEFQKNAESCFRMGTGLKRRLTAGVANLSVKSNVRGQKIEVGVDRSFPKKEKRVFFVCLVFFLRGSFNLYGYPQWTIEKRQKKG